MNQRYFGLLALLLTLGLAEIGRAQIIVLGQDRRVSSSAFVVLDGLSDNQQDSEVAPDTGPFNSIVISNASVVGAQALAEASQASEITVSSIQGSGLANGEAAVDEGGVAYAAAQSNVAISFMVEYPRAFTLEGFLEQNGNGTATVQVSRPFETVAWFAASDGTLPFEAHGFLEAGTYSMNITCGGGAAADPVGGTQVGSGAYDVSLVLSNPTDVPAGPAVAAALQASPNPFRASTRLSVPDGVTEVRVVDAGGRIVRTLTGTRSLVWDGRDGSGVPLASGVYWLKPVGDARAEAVKVVRLH